jgi:hypothetical protein
MLRLVVLEMGTNVSEEPAASVFRSSSVNVEEEGSFQKFVRNRRNWGSGYPVLVRYWFARLCDPMHTGSSFHPTGEPVGTEFLFSISLLFPI